MGKLKNPFLWWNLLAMVVTVVVLLVGVKFALDVYTHHGEEVVIPDLKHKLFKDADRIMTDMDLKMVVNDTGYVKALAPDCILGQSPEAGEKVKKGHLVYVTINSANTPTLVVPDVIDNCSLREAMAKLTAMGFRLGQPVRVAGEKDWVYGITMRGRPVANGDRVPVDVPLVIQAGSGMVDADDELNIVEPFDESSEGTAEGEIDEFEEVTAPPAAPAEVGAGNR